MAIGRSAFRRAVRQMTTNRRADYIFVPEMSFEMQNHRMSSFALNQIGQTLE